MVDRKKNLDDLDLIRGLIINEGYFDWKNNKMCAIVDNASFKKDYLTEEKIMEVYDKYPELYEFDQRFLDGKNYVIEGNIISRHRLLKNMSNYIGRGNALLESLVYKSNTEDIESVIAAVSMLEMSGNGVNLSQRI